MWQPHAQRVQLTLSVPTGILFPQLLTCGRPLPPGRKYGGFSVSVPWPINRRCSRVHIPWLTPTNGYFSSSTVQVVFPV
jgi:hypothetical protein